jgi:hypothetical protein
VEGGWEPMNREKLRKSGHAPGKERVAWFQDDVQDFDDDGAQSVAGSEKERRMMSVILARRSDHQRLSTSHQHLVLIGHTGTTGLRTDWGGIVGGHPTPQVTTPPHTSHIHTRTRTRCARTHARTHKKCGWDTGRG